MKVTRIIQTNGPAYPTRLQFLKRSILTGTLAVGLGAMLGGCRTAKPAPAFTEAGNVTLGGVMIMEPRTEPEILTTDYTIREGDTLSGIAKEKLGRANRWQEILKLNPGLTPTALKVGHSIRLPVPAATPERNITSPSVGSGSTTNGPLPVVPGSLRRG